MTLKEYFKENPKIAIALSGGIDSAYLLWEAVNEGADVAAYMVKTPFQPDFEVEDAQKICNLTGVKLKLIEVANLEEKILENSPLRCYYCKSLILSAIIKEAKKDGYCIVADGTNFSDNGDDRPGTKALAELGIHSPLRLAEMEKREIRERAKAQGNFFWDKPSYSCLATRIEKNQKIDYLTLGKIQRGEKLLLDLGFKDFRLRTAKGNCKIQVREEDLCRVSDNRKLIYESLREDFNEISLDLKVRNEESYEQDRSKRVVGESQKR